MAIESKERRIGGTLYRVTQLPAKRGRALLVRYVRLFGPGAGSFVGGLGRTPNGAFDAALTQGIAMGLHDFCERLTDAELAHVCDEFAAFTVVVESREIERRLSDIFDDHFAGKYDDMLAWIRFASEVNFASFFVGSAKGGMLQRLIQMLSAWTPPAASTGTSTASPPAPTIATS